MVDLVFGGAYSIKSYYMESDNPRQMRGASQLLLDAIAPPRNGPPLQQEPFDIRCIQDELDQLGGKLLYTIGSTFLGSVPQGKGEEAAVLCEKRFRELTVTACFAAVYMPNVLEADLANDIAFSSRIHPELLSLFDTRRFMLFHPADDRWSISMDQLIRPDTHTYIYPLDGPEKHQRCSRCNLRDALYYGELYNEGKFTLCPSCAHKEYRGGYIQRNRFRDECAEYAKTIKILIVTPNDPSVANTDNPFWFGTTEAYADAHGDVALLYADVNNLGGAGEKLKPYNLTRYGEFGAAVEETIKKSLYHALTMGVKQAYEDGHIKYPDSFDKKRGYPACFEIVSAGGDDICVLMPGSIALATASMLLDEFHLRWDREYRDTYGFSLSLSAGVAVGQSSTPGQFMLDTAEQLLSIAKERAHIDESKTTGAIDIFNLNSDAQWATSVRHKLRGNLHRCEGEQNAVLTLRPVSVVESKTLLQILGSLPGYISATMLRSLSEAAENLAIAEADLYAQYLWSKQNADDQKKLECLFGLIKQALAGSTNKRFGMFIPVNGILISPWRDLVELRGQMGKQVIS